MSLSEASPLPSTSVRGTHKSSGRRQLPILEPSGSKFNAFSGPPKEYTVRMAADKDKIHHIMRFNDTLNVDFAKWKSVKLEREDNLRDSNSKVEEMPKFGAGSEFNRDFREELRRKKYGINPRKYRAEAQPWILKVGGEIKKNFKGIREGGVGANASFYVFKHTGDGIIEAYPVNEWYNFQPIHRYKALSAEEAEQEFSRRKKVLNFFSLMLRKRLKGDEEEEMDPEEAKAKSKTSKKGDLKISEMDEWVDSDDISEADSDDPTANEKKRSDTEDESKKKKKKPIKKTEKKKRNASEEAFEDSDDGDGEGREMDYDTESSDEEPEAEAKVSKAMKSVAEEDALRELLTSDEEEEEVKAVENEAAKKAKEEVNKEKKKSKKAIDEDDSSSDFSTDSSDSDIELDDRKIPKPIGAAFGNHTKQLPILPTTSKMALPQTSGKDVIKRKNSERSTETQSNSSVTSTPTKRSKVVETKIPSPVQMTAYSPPFSTVMNNEFGITEEAVRRYLMRKPMTATELLTKFKNKKTGVSSDRLVETMTQILKKINPMRQTIQGKMYLSIKVK